MKNFYIIFIILILSSSMAYAKPAQIQMHTWGKTFGHSVSKKAKSWGHPAARPVNRSTTRPMMFRQRLRPQ